MYWNSLDCLPGRVAEAAAGAKGPMALSHFLWSPNLLQTLVNFVHLRCQVLSSTCTLCNVAFEELAQEIADVQRCMSWCA